MRWREVKTVLTAIGCKRADKAEAPYRNGWLYVASKRIKSNSLSKFAPGWNVNLPMSCRIVGDKLEGFEGAKITSLPMSIRPGDDAQDAELQLQVMLTKGESVSEFLSFLITTDIRFMGASTPMARHRREKSRRTNLKEVECNEK